MKQKSKHKLMLAAISIAILTSCMTKSSVQTLEYPLETEPIVFEKLLGTWKSEDGKSFERWTKESKDKYHSTVYMLNGKDTMFIEQADIFKENNRWIFENLVTGQNEGKKVRFTSADLTENVVQFVNPAHDFPNEIHYSLPDLKTINAFIVGKNEQGGMDTIPFNYTKM